MKKLIIVFTVLIIGLSVYSSFVGVLNYRTLNFESFTTSDGKHIELLKEGIYKGNIKTWVLSGMPWDIVRLAVGIPLILLSFVFYLKGSLKSTMIFIAVLFSFFYQYMLWAFGWHFNSLFLVYTFTYGLSLSTLFLVIFSLDIKTFEHSVSNKFPVKTVSVFLFVGAGLLFFKCLGEIAPMLSSGELTEPFVGFYNLFDQSMDMGILVPFSVFIGVLLLKRNVYGYLLSSVILILLLNIGLCVVTGQAVMGVMTNTFSNQIPGIAVFCVFMLIDLFILIRIFRNIGNPIQA